MNKATQKLMFSVFSRVSFSCPLRPVRWGDKGPGNTVAMALALTAMQLLYEDSLQIQPPLTALATWGVWAGEKKAPSSRNSERRLYSQANTKGTNEIRSSQELLHCRFVPLFLYPTMDNKQPSPFSYQNDTLFLTCDQVFPYCASL